MKKKITGFVLLLAILCLVLNGCDVSTQISESVVAELCEERNNNVDYDYSTAERKGNELICEGTIYHEFNEYMVVKGEGVTGWTYDLKKGGWVCSNEVITMYTVLTTNVEGLWEKDYSDDYIRIRNRTLTGFEVFVDDADFDKWVYVTWNKYPYGFLDGSDVIESDLEDGVCRVVFSGESADEDDVRVTFTSRLNGEFEVDVSVRPSDSSYGTIYTANYENYKPE